MAPGQGAKRGGAKTAFNNHGATANKRHSTARTDKDGDLVMGSAPRNKDNKIGKPQQRSGNAGHTRPRVNVSAIQKDLMDTVKPASSTVKPPRTSNLTYNNQEFKITGWTTSKAAASQDRGASSLIQFLERKGTSMKNKQAVSRGEKAPKPVKVLKWEVAGDDIFVTARPEHTAVILKMDGWEWAGTNIKIEKGQSPSSTAQNQNSTTETPETGNVRVLLQNFLSRRYNEAQKLLDLSAIGTDADLGSIGMFKESKFFPALMKVCDEQFTTQQHKRDAVHSITLAGNELTDLKTVTSLAQTFPDLKNLDLSNNLFAGLSSLTYWKNKFRHLDQLVLSNNPIEQQVPDYHNTIKSWYPTLRMLNLVQIRSDQEVVQSTTNAKKGLPVGPASFHDEGQIAETFIRNFFLGYDTDRQALVNMYYDTKSTFSFSVNTHAMRDPQAQTKTEPQEWEAYIRKSRNLKHLTHLPARASRQHIGPASITELFSSLPPTQHPDLANEGEKWCIESMSMPGLPDPTGQAPGGLNGFLITIHGEFMELDASSRQPKKQRSFDRSFIIGPGVNPGVPVRIVSDTLTIRAYGGYAAWKPDAPTNEQAAAASSEQDMLVQELSNFTKMTLPFARQCLEDNNWVPDAALAAFERAKSQLGPEAFIQG